jgi:hypothetical protein
MLKKEKIKIVEQAIELISDPDKWTTEWFARKSNNSRVDPEDSKACKWCAAGAIMKFAKCHYEMDMILSEIYDKKKMSLDYINDIIGREAAIYVMKEYIKYLC